MTNRLPASPLGALGLIAIATLSCSSGDKVYATMGMLGDPSSTVVGTNLVFADVSIDGMSELAPDLNFGMLIDSGSPVVLVDPSFYSTAPAPVMTDDISTTLNLGLIKDGSVVVTIDQIPALQLSSAMMDEIGMGGILGGNVMRDFPVQLDYAAPMMDGFCLGCTSGPRSDVESPGAVIPFQLSGGSGGQSAYVELSSTLKVTVGDIPATRIPVNVILEGTMHPFILDTGASEVSLRSTVYSALVQDGRAQLMGFGVTTVVGSSTASVTRAKTIQVGGETISDPPVMTIGDTLLDGISTELGHQVDGLLGGSFLRNFLVTIDYPKGELHLQSYNTETWVDEFKRVGLDIGDTSQLDRHRYAIATVYPGTDAESQGLVAGDEIISIDGTSLDTLGWIAADALLDGTVGTTKTIVYTSSDAGTPTTVSVLVDDLIPNP